MGYGKVDDFVRSIFDSAVLKERAAYNMYVELAEKVSGTARDILLRIAEEELVHESLFAKKDIEILKIVNREQLSKLNLLNGVNKSFLISDELEEINKILDFAINEEEKAYNDYNMLVKYLNFGDVRETFEEVARQELNHKHQLQKIKAELK